MRVEPCIPKRLENLTQPILSQTRGMVIFAKQCRNLIQFLAAFRQYIMLDSFNIYLQEIGWSVEISA